MQALRDQGQPSPRCRPALTGHANLEAGAGAEMPVVPNAAAFAAGAPDPADDRARDRPLPLGCTPRMITGIAIKRPLSTLKVTAFRGQASVKVLSMICRWTLEQCGQVKVRKSRPESHGSIAVSFICESQAVHCGPLFCASSMGVASSPMVADGRAVTDRSCHHAPPNTWVNFARSRNLMNCIAPLTRK
jgi:hypothetical protein